MTKVRIVVAAALVVVVVLFVVAFSLLGGDDGDDDRAGDGSGSAAQESGGGDDGDSGDDAPRLKTLATKRAEGMNATVAVAGEATARPREFWLRVSAAPKQVVKGSWNVSCAGGGNDLDTYEVTPPALLKLRVPTKNARSCIAGASGQLKGEGRVKLAILRDG
jgi:hypothetical protein